MRQRKIGNRTVGAIGLGGASWSLRSELDDRSTEHLLEAAIGEGVSYLDTAPAYTTADEDSHNEKLIARVLARLGFTSGAPDGVMVATKGGHYRDHDTWPIDGRPASIRRQCETSLRALGAEALDLYYLHWPDPKVPFEDSVGAIEQLRLEGKVVRTGISNVDLDLFERGLAISPISAVENSFSPYDTADRALVEACTRHGIAFVSYSPLGGSDRTPLADVLPQTAALAEASGISLESAVLGWELSLSEAVIPVVGASRMATLLDSLSAAELRLGPEIGASIEKELMSIDTPLTTSSPPL
jgi:aryl-alcohol dehydrogenase-like predicted oxidoreductase